MSGVTLRGAVRLKTGVTEFGFSRDDEGNGVLSWASVPAGRWSYDVFMDDGNEESPLLYGCFVSSGRVTPDLPDEQQAVAGAVVVQLPEGSGCVQVMLDNASSAAWYAEQAKKYAANAGNSEVSAANSAAAAASSATDAAASAASAASSSSDAAHSAANAASSEAKAASSEANAMSSATAAASSASNASLSEANAAASQSSAAASASDAATSATSAATSANNAAASESSAESSETAASKSASDAATSATSAANSATAAQQALAAMPQVDASGNMTLAGNITAAGGTFDGTVNANGGVNIPQAVGAPTNESGVNRLYASGLAAVTEAFASQSFLSSFNSYGAAATVEQTVPGWCFRLKQTAKGSCTIKVHFLNPFLGVSNYSGWCGFVLPLAAGNTGSTVARKISFSIGKRGSVVEKTAESLDMFTLSPAPGSTASFPRFVDVTFYLQSDASSSPAGYPVRVRELMYDTAARKWVVHETQSVIPSFNTNPSATMFLACVQNRVAISGAEAGLWIGSNAYDTRRLLCIADLHALQDSFDFTGVDRVYWDSSGINAFSFIGAMRQLTVPGYNQPNGSYAAFRALETRLIQSTSTYEFTPYE